MAYFGLSYGSTGTDGSKKAEDCLQCYDHVALGFYPLTTVLLLSGAWSVESHKKPTRLSKVIFQFQADFEFAGSLSLFTHIWAVLRSYMKNTTHDYISLIFYP